jgi:hypothetical protein
MQNKEICAPPRDYTLLFQIADYHYSLRNIFFSLLFLNGLIKKMMYNYALYERYYKQQKNE